MRRCLEELYVCNLFLVHYSSGSYCAAAFQNRKKLLCLKHNSSWSTEQEMSESYNPGGGLHISLVNAVLAALVCLTVPLDALDANASKYTANFRAI